MLGDREGAVTRVEAFDLHGVTYYDVELTLDDGSSQSARLGPEAVPEGLEPGDAVVATIAANMVVSLQRR